ncbi:Uncharacterised protein [Yersinia kristensenii]|nr:Uncharacterised protein [Yersinia kristensenii]
MGGQLTHLRPPTDAPQIAFVGTVAPLTAGGGFFYQTLCAAPTILLQGDTGEINLALRAHFAPEVFQRADLRGQVSTG